MRLEVGDVFAGFTIEGLLGAGGLGMVYLAQHPTLRQPVALKLLSDVLGADPKVRSRFEREATLAAQLDHPNIVPVHDHSAPGDPAPWIAMKYVPGGDVATLIAAQGRLSAADAVRLTVDAARGLEYAHRHGILHRDVKPANLLVDVSNGETRALVTDFGIARTLDDTVTASGLLASFAYTAPERFEGGPVDLRADVYSLGCTLYEMLTGTIPFPRRDQAAMVGAHLGAPPPRPSDLRPGLPTGFDDVIATAMAKSPEHRYPDCPSLAVAAAAVVRRAQQTTVIRNRVGQAVPPAAAPTAARSQASRRRLAAVAGTVATVVVATVAIAISDRPATPSHTPASTTITTSPTPSASNGVAALPFDMTKVWLDAMAVSPAGVVFIAGPIPNEHVSGIRWLTAGDTAIESFQLPKPNSPLSMATTSDGILYISSISESGQAVFRFDPSSKTLTRTPFTGFTGICDLLTVDTSGAVYAIDAYLRTGPQSTPKDEWTYRVLRFDPGTSNPTILPFPTLVRPLGIGSDGAGNIYVLDRDDPLNGTRKGTGAGRVYELAPNANAATDLALVGVDPAQAMTVDVSGALYMYSMTSPRQILRFAPGATTAQTLPFIDSTGAEPHLGVDRVGNVFVGEGYGQRVLELPHHR